MNEQGGYGGNVQLPREPIHRLIKPLSRFLHVEAASGLVLLTCAVASLILANSPYAESYLGFWKTPMELTVGDFRLEGPLKHWINDGLMAIFFFVIGLEVKREIAIGELRSIRRAALPLVGAIGGMAAPAGIFLALQMGEPGQRGWGIPMATDIAFVVGCMAVLGRRIPAGLRTVLLSIAIADDVGAILIIALGYTETIHAAWLGTGLAGIGAVVLLQRLGVRSMGVYTIVGAVIWLAFHESGVHATIAGVALGMLTPARPYLQRGVGGKMLQRASDLLHGTWEEEAHRAAKVSHYRRITKETISPLEYLINRLHPWVAFLIMPLFALANAGVQFRGSDVLAPVSVAVILGLLLGKPVGILTMSWLSIKVRLAQLPPGVTWRHMAGGGWLSGIGFTMSLFISSLAFRNNALLSTAKVGVLVGSAASAMIGLAILGSKSAQQES